MRSKHYMGCVKVSHGYFMRLLVHRRSLMQRPLTAPLVSPIFLGKCIRVWILWLGGHWQVEQWPPFIDTLDYIFHTPGLTATKVRGSKGKHGAS